MTCSSLEPRCFSTFLRRYMHCIWWADFARCCMSAGTNWIHRGSAGRWPWKSLLITGTLWMGCGCSCWRCSTSDSSSALVLLPSVKFRNRFRHPLDLLLTQFGKHGKRHDFRRCFFRVGKTPHAVAEVGVNALQVQRNRIIHSAADFAVRQKLLQFVATHNANRVLVENVFAMLGNVRSSNLRDAGQQFRILRRMQTPSPFPLFQVAQLDPQNGGLNFVQPAVPAGLHAVVA